MTKIGIFKVIVRPLTSSIVIHNVFLTDLIQI